MSFQLTSKGISVGSALRTVCKGASGGVVLFLGRVRRDRTARGRVRALYYEAYRPLATREMARLEREAAQRWATEHIVVVHRLGVVPVGEVSVLVAVSAPHRAQAFDACRFLIDRLKSDVPIWKTDVLEGERARSGSRRRRRPSRTGARAAG